MHFTLLVLMLEGPGPWDTRGQAMFTLTQLGHEKVKNNCITTLKTACSQVPVQPS